MKIQLITEDFKGSKYISIDNCPLARALKRMGYSNVNVGGEEVIVYGDDYTHTIPEHWDPFLVGELIKKANNGEEVTYEIELTELN